MRAKTVDMQPSPGAYPAPGYAAYVIAILMLATVMSMLDRQLPSLLVQPIRQAFNVSDTQISFLHGLSFAIFYAIAGVPFGRLVDASNRRNLLIVGILLWSAMTVWAAFAGSFEELLAARVGVGVGEACLAPACYSLIADYVVPGHRGRAIGVYSIANAMGSGASLFIGAAMLAVLQAAGGLSLPVLGHFAPWQGLFLCAGVPGLIAAALMLTVREPARQDVSDVAGGEIRASMREVLAHMGQHRATLACLVVNQTMIAYIGYATTPWVPTLLLRRFNIPVATGGLLFGLVVIAASPIGNLLAGFLSDRWAARNVSGARFRPLVLSSALLLPALIWPLAPTPFLSLCGLALVMIAFGVGVSAAPPAIHELMPNRMRGQAVSGYLLISLLFGLGFGPTATALITDHVFHSDQALPWSIALATIPGGLLSLLVTILGVKHHARSREAISQSSASSHPPSISSQSTTPTISGPSTCPTKSLPTFR